MSEIPKETIKVICFILIVIGLFCVIAVIKACVFNYNICVINSDALNIHYSNNYIEQTGE